MPVRRSRWLKGCVIGCGVGALLAIGLIGLGAGWFFTLHRRMGRAIETRGELEKRFDGRESFTTTVDGSIDPDRLERFIEVQEALAPLCPRFDASVGRIESIESRGPDARPSLGQILGVVRGALRFPGLMADYHETRNRALLAAEMGLGEYSYLYVLAYASGPGDREGAGRILSRGVRDTFVAMLERQAALMREMPGLAEELAALEAEIRMLRDDRGRRPWEDALPEPLARSVHAYEHDLARLDCRLAHEFALGRAHREGITIRAE